MHQVARNTCGIFSNDPTPCGAALLFAGAGAFNNALKPDVYPVLVGKHRILFVCTHNSARSQMAEGMLRAWGGEAFDAVSAGTEVTSVRPEAVTVMEEIGIDIRGQRSKSVETFLGQPFDRVITVCDQARQSCPVFPGAGETVHWSVEDPSAAQGTDEDRRVAFRQARDDLGNRIRGLIEAG